MNADELVERTRRASGVELDALLSDPEVLEVVNDAYLEICDTVPGAYLDAVGELDTVPGGVGYTLQTSAVEKPRHLTLVDGHSPPVPLQQVGEPWMDAAPPSEGVPRYYDVRGNRIRLWPTPNDEYHIRVQGTRNVQELEGTDEPIFPERFHLAIVYLAAATILEDEGQFEEAQVRASSAERHITRLDRFYNSSDDGTPMIFGGGGRSRRAGTRWRGMLWPRG